MAGAYEYENAFDDVNGWDLQHARRVRWCPLPVEYRFDSMVFGANPPKCSRVWNAEVVDYADRFIKSPPTHWQTLPLPDLPLEDPPLDQIPQALGRSLLKRRSCAWCSETSRASATTRVRMS